MIIKIKAIELRKADELELFAKLIELFDPQVCASSAKGQEINFPLNDQIEVYATLDLSVEYAIEDSNKQNEAIDVFTRFDMFIYDNDGDEVEGIENSDIYNLIEKYDWIKYF